MHPFSVADGVPALRAVAEQEPWEQEEDDEAAMPASALAELSALISSPTSPPTSTPDKVG